MPCTPLILNNLTGEKLLFFSHDPILAKLTSADIGDTTAMWLKVYVKVVDNVTLNFSAFAQSKAGFVLVADDLYQNYRGINEFIFDLSGVLSSYTTTTVPQTGYVGDAGVLVAFYYEYGRFDADNVEQAEQGESNVMYACRGVSKIIGEYNDADDYTFSDTPTDYRKFLTYNKNIFDGLLPLIGQAPSKSLTRVQKDFLYFVLAASDCAPATEDNYYLVLDYKINTGVAFQILKPIALKSGVKYIHVGIQEVATFFEIPFDIAQISSYKIEMVQGDTNQLSESRTYKLVEEDCEEVFTLLFQNRLGGFETIICRGVHEIGLDRNYSEYAKSFNYNFGSSDPLTKMREASILDTKLLRTGWLRREEFEWLQDLTCSVNMYLLNQDMSVIPIKAKQVDYKRKTNEQLYSITLDISYTNIQGSLSN